MCVHVCVCVCACVRRCMCVCVLCMCMLRIHTAWLKNKNLYAIALVDTVVHLFTSTLLA